MGLFERLILHKLSLFLQKFILLEVRGQLVDLLAKAHLLCIALVHQALLLVDQLLFELLLPDLLLFHLTGDLLLNSSLLGLSATIPRLLLVAILPEEGLVLLLLPRDTIDGLLILVLLLRLLLLG